MTTKNVPLEPTEAMLDAALRLQGEDAFYAKAPALMSALVKIYTAMVKAYPPSGGEVVAWLCDEENGNLRDATCSEHARNTYAKAGRTITPLYTSPRVVDEAMVQRLAIHMATKESANCTTLDAAVNHVNNWKRLIPEATEALQAALEAK